MTALEVILDQVMESAVNTTNSAINSQKSTVKVIQEHTEKLKIALDTSEVSSQAHRKAGLLAKSMKYHAYIYIMQLIISL